jgi:hypothetical protein
METEQEAPSLIENVEVEEEKSEADLEEVQRHLL